MTIQLTPITILGGGWDSIYVNDQSDKVNNLELCVDLFKSATDITGAKWPEAKTFTSPCPTLMVISEVSKQMIAREELKRMADRPGFGEDGKPVKLTKRKRAALVADKVIVQGVLGNTIGRVGRLGGRLLLGRIPETAKQGSFQDEKPLDDKPAADLEFDDNHEQGSVYIDVIDDEDKSKLEGEIFAQVFSNGKTSTNENEREWKVGEVDGISGEAKKELASV